MQEKGREMPHVLTNGGLIMSSRKRIIGKEASKKKDEKVFTRTSITFASKEISP